MNENEKKPGIDPELTETVKAKLAGNNETQASSELEDIDPEELMKTSPMISIALSLYHIERSLKGLVYLNNVNADENLAYNRDYFFAIFGGPDPELVQEEEIRRLQKLEAEHQEREKTRKSKFDDPKKPIHDSEDPEKTLDSETKTYFTPTPKDKLEGSKLKKKSNKKHG